MRPWLQEIVSSDITLDIGVIESATITVTRSRSPTVLRAITSAARMNGPSPADSGMSLIS